ncbi:MAG: DNA-directed RNA polymerase subunit N [Candidatus Freyarchaeota archaeon]|nr:DNA-directed RNA polymerase subunit N [Candidatus Freyrarchaeum guaymaensis]HDO80647.1 DNA-directed RNA polymerase subunit N [Candidatus Bathyarchaeota archaeon]
MMIPIRCFTCGMLIADKWEEFSRRVRQGEDPKTVLDSLGLKRYCCRRMLLSHVNLIDEILPFSQHVKKEENEY